MYGGRWTDDIGLDGRGCHMPLAWGVSMGAGSVIEEAQPRRERCCVWVDDIGLDGRFAPGANRMVATSF